MDMMDRVSRLEDTLDELSTRVKHDPDLRDLPEWRAILDRVIGDGLHLLYLLMAANVLIGSIAYWTSLDKQATNTPNKN